MHLMRPSRYFFFTLLILPSPTINTPFFHSIILFGIHVFLRSLFYSIAGQSFPTAFFQPSTFFLSASQVLPSFLTRSLHIISFHFLYFLKMSTPEKPTNFPPRESLSGEVGEFVGSPCGPEISDGSGHHITTPPATSGSDDEPLFEAFGENIPGVLQKFPFLGLLFHYLLPQNP
jgi:hypothetical protein